ncbi:MULTISPECIES: LptA/OstA family protein [unclassified Campylobacter]|uniref:LptA/OstA family protein n=1 Tax=unclassified Campylobacter TaxID=2593542 RepID=UPI001237B039|nr:MULTISPECIES: LptA/OstA family protein [unclassified Campylobacter]KAA6226421.1 hypothetical protein FMM57_06470 [Campylobacter sp. LR286c]KAA6226541.1 hypothetical protein FMM54_03765 [Campylobacter sp. LR185c]KAA6226909.1 hypothetical protein FMM55_05025 [Campylobacter sp. LR196d]KAA6233653.1 hypothetical protein FMM58_01670 [Campylobacter sp. LR291e]KAA6233873.1 hypothetical protein FMM56_02895 [Campylobacter sp. LR264d]
MAIRIFSILIALFTISFTIISLQDPYSLNIQNYNLDYKQIQAYNINAYELNSSNTKSYYKANSWTRYKEKDEFKDFYTRHLDFNISANSLEILNDNSNKIIFKDKVTYIGDDKKITSDEVIYEQDKRFITSNSGFKAYIGKNIINGNVLKYDLNNKILEVQGAKAWLNN